MSIMKIITNEEFKDYFFVKVNLPAKKIALIKLVDECVQCTRIQLYSQVFNLFEKTYPGIPLPLRLYSDEHLSFQDGWSFTTDDCAEYLAE